MIKFEEHDGQLFRMLEKPVQLKEKNTNVLVQFITHGIIGEYVMEHWLDCGQENVPIYIDDVDSDGDVMVWIDENRNEHHCCPFPMFEIIGTLVKEGSKEWALYQLMQGEKVMNIEWIKRKSKDLKYCCCENGMLVYNPEYVLANPLPIGDFLTPLFGLVAIPDGWQIYKEPKPEQPKSAYQAGDFVVCTYYRSPLPQKNSYERVIEVSGNGIVTKANDGCVTEYDINGNHGDINGWHIERLVKPEEYIICIGCLSGTIGKSSDTDRFLMWHSSPKIDFDYSIIKFSALDATTLEIVESLLKAQEEHND